MNLKTEYKALCLRAQRKTIYDIAAQLDVAPQTIHKLLRALPGDAQQKHFKPPDLSQEQIEMIIKAYVSTRNIEKAAIAANVPEKSVAQLFVYLKGRFSRVVKSPYYPKVAEWMMRNNMTISDFAKAIDYPSASLGHTLAGRYKGIMTYELAVKICDYTGLKLSDVFAVQIANGDVTIGGEHT